MTTSGPDRTDNRLALFIYGGGALFLAPWIVLLSLSQPQEAGAYHLKLTSLGMSAFTVVSLLVAAAAFRTRASTAVVWGTSAATYLPSLNDAVVKDLDKLIQPDCPELDHLLVVSQRHLEAVLDEYVCHYNEARPHRGLDLDQPLPRPATSTTGDGKVIRHDVLGGIVHEYERAA